MCGLQCARAKGNGPTHCTLLEVFFFGAELLVVHLPKPYTYRSSFFSLKLRCLWLWCARSGQRASDRPRRPLPCLL